jgi:hypothetical protein
MTLTVKSLSRFTQELVTLIGRPTDLRPFVCDGSPLDCEAFVVGFNPATEMAIDFWEFWSEEQGFDKQHWLEAYRSERRNRPLGPGKIRRSEVSNSRRVLEWVLEEAAPVKCLETNIYARPSERLTDLESDHRLTAPFDFLLGAVEPKIVIAHGKDAGSHIKATLPTVETRCVPHFSRGWSQERARRLGREIRDACRG